MERSPRSAGVRPRIGAMAQYRTLRSFVITLAIAIAVTTSPASGFTIRRAHTSLDSTPDQETGESTQLEVRYDLKALNDNKAIGNSKTKGELDPKVIAISDSKILNKTNKNDETVTAASIFVNKTADIPTQISVDTISHFLYDKKSNSTETTRNSFTTSAPSTSQTTTTEPEKNQDISTKSTLPSSLATESQINTFEENSENEKRTIGTTVAVNEIKISEIQNSSQAKPTFVSENYKGEIDSTQKHEISTAITNLNYSDANKSVNQTEHIVTTDSYAERKDSLRSISETDQIAFNVTAVEEIKPDQRYHKGERSTRDDGLDIFQAFTTTSSGTDVTKVTFEEPTTEMTTNVYTESFTTESISPTLPSWKKYTTIDRKRTSTENTTLSGKDMARAESGQTRISLEKVFSDTPIPSLERLRNDLINAQDSTTLKLETSTRTETDGRGDINDEASTSTQLINSRNDTDMTKLEIVSKRAGYKDNRETTTPKPKEATTTEFIPKVSGNVNDTAEMFSTMYETEPSEFDVPDNKTETVYESQSQLAEDAIKEELLKEETMNDNEENFKRQHEEGTIVPKVTPRIKNIDEMTMLREVVTEDSLSVKPITYDKKKSSILYTISPNYKPLKKIDVQPSKLFVRDPDDNSWRNESISSLGIVFNPKNASKSFTQVLKNKTETELGNMTDRDNKGDVPDLRVRLEKIAEVRKYKKKGINKYGDTVYSDYEESGENINHSREETTSPMSPPSEPVLSFNPPSSTSSSTPEYDLTVNAISREHLDFFKHTTSPLTTEKPKKFYNLAEYYDATDEYDAEYANLHKIDLKKFTKPIKPKNNFPTQPPELLRTKPARDYQPERVATVQYFPPTQKVAQKVNLNDYDTDFNRKLNMFTLKEPRKNVVPIATVSSIPSETYDQLNKLSVKPVSTPLYKTEQFGKNLYLTNQPRVSEPPSGFVPNDGNFNRASYVIKHYRDFINEAAKEGEDDRSGEYPYTEAPLRGVTMNELAKMTTPKDPVEDDYEYDVKFRKDIINRFVDNFNQNSERFKVDFPILYNSSVVHSQAQENGKTASSSAFLKRLYEAGHTKPSSFLSNKKPCDPHCDMTVELSPAYELHYYVPDQEEKEEMEPRPITVPYRYRL